MAAAYEVTDMARASGGVDARIATPDRGHVLVRAQAGGPLFPMTADRLPRHYRIVDSRTGETVGARRWCGEPIRTGSGSQAVVFQHGLPRSRVGEGKP
jgi:hypothetical protein